MKIDKKTLDKIVETLLFEDMSYGVFDRPGPTEEMNPDFKPTVAPSLPLKPTEMMSAQLATERPPIDDDDYIPASVSELRQAASAVAELVPPDHVEKFYMRIKDLLTQLEDEKAAEEIPRSKQVAASEEEEEIPVKSPKPSLNKESRAARLKRIVESINEITQKIERIKRVKRLTEGKKRSSTRHNASSLTLEALLKEVESGSGMPPVTRVPSPVRTAPKLSAGALKALDEPEYVPEVPAASDEERRLQDIAQELEFKSGPSGARQYLQSLFDVIKYQISEVGIDEIDNFVKNELALDFLDLAVAGGVMSDEDASYYDQNIQELVETDEFRYFFGEIFSSGFSALKKASERDTLEQIAELGIPAAVQQTVFNQVMGRADKKDSTIVRRLEAAGITDSAAQNTILQTIRENFVDLQATASEVQGDLIELMREKFESMSEQKKMQLVTNALGEASSWRDAEILKELEKYINAAAQTGQEVDFNEVMSTLETIEDKTNPLYTKIMSMVQPVDQEMI